MQGRIHRSTRLDALDSLRGLIIVLMALDHASLFIAEQHWSEFWGLPLPEYGGDGLALLTRVVSHLCAPGFFALMGAGMALFGASRRERGWSDGRIAKHFALRGSLLIVVDFILVLPAFALGTLDAILNENTALMPNIPGEGGIPYFSPGVLSALGASMLVGGLFNRLSAYGKAALGATLLIGCQLLIPSSESAEIVYPVATRLFLVAGQSGIAMITYPLLPWLAVTLLGMALGHALRSEPSRVLRLALPVGGAALVLFIAMRINGGFGTHHPLPSPDWMGLLTVTKYPPSLAYLLLTLGANGVLLFALHRFDRPWGPVTRVLRVYGRAPLFFYVMHLYVYAAMGLAVPGHTSLIAMYPLWLVGAALLYPACLRYERFKRGRAEESVWRLF